MKDVKIKLWFYSQKRNVKFTNSAGKRKCDRMDSITTQCLFILSITLKRYTPMSRAGLLAECQSLERAGDHREGHVHTFQLDPSSINCEWAQACKCFINFHWGI